VERSARVRGAATVERRSGEAVGASVVLHIRLFASRMTYIEINRF
jgi:hypothetical protein